MSAKVSGLRALCDFIAIVIQGHKCTRTYVYICICNTAHIDIVFMCFKRQITYFPYLKFCLQPRLINIHTRMLTEASLTTDDMLYSPATPCTLKLV